jgi:hypothetical protein
MRLYDRVTVFPRHASRITCHGFSVSRVTRHVSRPVTRHYLFITKAILTFNAPLKFDTKTTFTMKKMNLILLALLVPATLVSFGSAPGKKDIVLAYKVPAGQSFTMSTSTSSNITTEQMGQSMSIDMTSSTETAYKAVAAQADGSMQYEMEYKARKQSVQSPMGGGDTDFSTWIGKKVQFNLSPRGEVSGFLGFDQLPEISTASGEKLTGELVQKGVEQEFTKFPEGPVKMGKSWNTKDSTEVPYGGSSLKSIVETKYTPKDRVKIDGMDCLKIEFEGKESLSGTFEQQGAEIEISRQTTSTGVLIFAIDKGMVVSIEGSSTGATQIYIAAASMTIPQNMTTKSSMTVKFD